MNMGMPIVMDGSYIQTLLLLLLEVEFMVLRMGLCWMPCDSALMRAILPPLG
jgi:hypothetical protein